MERKERTFAVIGLGTFGTTVALELTRFGNYVIGIDKDETAASSIAARIGSAVIVDGKDEAALRETGLADCDVALVAMGEDIAASVLTVMNLKLIGVPKVWAKSTGKTHHRILSKLGVDRVVHPEEEMGRHMAQVMHNPLVRDYVSLGNGYHVVNFLIPDGLEGKTLADLELMETWELRCIGVMRGAEYLGDDDCTEPLSSDDKLLLLGQRANLRAFAASL